MSKRLILRLFWCVVLVYPGLNTLWGQKEKHYYSTYETNERRLLLGSDSLNLLDSSLDTYHQYHAAFRNNFGHLDLGNSGTAMFPIVYRTSQVNGFNLGWNYLDAHRFFSNEQSSVYKVKKPITRLHYTQGPQELLGLNALHSQNIKPNWNVGVEFQRLKEDGFYLRQKTGQYNTRLFNWYHSKDQRYHVIANATWNRIRNEESGGVVSKQAFDTLPGPVRNPLVNYYPNTALNTLRSNHFSVTQLYRLGEKIYLPTEAVDSLNNPILDTIATFIPQHQLSLKTSYQSYTNIFEIGNLEGMPFTNFFLDSLATFDSLRYRNAGVSLGYQLGKYRNKKAGDSLIKERFVYLSANLDYQRIRVDWEGDYAAYNNFSVHAEAGTRSWLKSATGIAVNYYQALTGYNSGDMDARIQAAQVVGPILLGFELRQKLKSPDFFQTYYFGNHHFWHHTDLKKEQTQILGLSIRNKGIQEKLKLKASYLSLSNYIFLNQAEEIVQETNNIGVAQVELLVKQRIRWFYFETQGVYQSSSRQSSLPLSRFLLKQSVYAQSWMFQDKLLSRIGLDLFWVESFAAPEYVAPLRSWKVQDPANAFMVGNYPYINAYFTGRIQTVTFTLMFHHVADGLFGSSYYSSPFYPMQTRAFRFRICWNMYE